jgi:ribosomal protein L22
MRKENAMSQDIDEMIEQVHAYVADATSLLAQGEYSNLSELEPRVKVICEVIQGMRVDQAQVYLPQLEALYAHVDGLKAHMQEHQADIKQEMGGLTYNQRATHAYAKSGSLSDTK